jgi:regulator of sirC expression with transglutaminase-like and TPR domain
VIRRQLIHSFTHAALSPEPDLAVAALMIARVEYPKLDAGPYLDQLDAFGCEAKRRVAAADPVDEETPPGIDPEKFAQVLALNKYLFGEMRFVGNETHYEDPRNSFLNEVLERRTGIPITLALLYMEVARRAGVNVEGVNAPRHFLLRCRARRGLPYDDLIIDAFHGGALLQPDHELMPRATKPQILVRMLLNLKQLYVRMHSFPQAHAVTELLLAVDPSALNELRDRGLLSYHLRDFSSALRDLETYLRLTASRELNESERDEQTKIWEHVKTLRKRVASLN